MPDLTTKQVAERLGVQHRTAQKYVTAGLFPHAHLEETPRGPVWYVPESDLEAFKRPPNGRPRHGNPSPGALTRRKYPR